MKNTPWGWVGVHSGVSASAGVCMTLSVDSTSILFECVQGWVGGGNRLSTAYCCRQDVRTGGFHASEDSPVSGSHRTLEELGL